MREITRQYVDCPPSAFETVHVYRDGPGDHIADAGGAAAHAYGYFPSIDIPVISLVWNFTGLQPQEMEQRITSNSERAVNVLVNDVEHSESQSLNGISIVKIYFQPGANVQTALAQTTAIVQTILRTLPPGTTPPLVAIYSACHRAGHPDRDDQRQPERTGAFRFRK